MAKEKIDLAKSVTPPVYGAIHVSKSAKEAAAEKLKELISEETRLVKGIFQSFETPGASVKITVKKYPGIPHFERVMTDGEIYEIPLYVARHLNGVDVSAGACGDPNKKNQMIGTCSYPVHGFKYQNGNAPASTVDALGTPVPLIGVSKRVKRYGFQSMEFGGAIE